MLRVNTPSWPVYIQVIKRLFELYSVCQAMIYHLSDIRGMSEWREKFGVLGVDTNLMQKAVQTAGSFMLKASELQQ